MQAQQFQLPPPDPPPLGLVRVRSFSPQGLHPALDADALSAEPPGVLALEPDELGPVRVTVVLQPIGVDQPGGVVLRALADCIQQAYGFAMLAFFGSPRDARCLPPTLRRYG